MRNKILYIIVLTIIFSCSSWKTELIESGDINKARQNVVLDFYNTYNKKKKNVAFRVNQMKDSDYLYSFSIAEIDVNKISPSINDTIGGYPKTYVYTEYIKKNNTIFLWYNDNKIITREIVSEMQEYNIIDSTFIKIAKGELELSEDELPVLINDDSKKATFYYVCKENISKYEKTRSNRVLSVEKYPKVDCTQ